MGCLLCHPAQSFSCVFTIYYDVFEQIDDGDDDDDDGGDDSDGDDDGGGGGGGGVIRFYVCSAGCSSCDVAGCGVVNVKDPGAMLLPR